MCHKNINCGLKNFLYDQRTRFSSTWKMGSWMFHNKTSQWHQFCHRQEKHALKKYDPFTFKNTSCFLRCFSCFIRPKLSWIQLILDSFRNKRFMLDEMIWRNASKFAIFYIYKNPKLLFPFFISCSFTFFP